MCQLEHISTINNSLSKVKLYALEWFVLVSFCYHDECRKVMLLIIMWPELFNGCYAIGDNWIYNGCVRKCVTGMRCVLGIVDEILGTLTRNICDSRTAWRGQCGIEVRVISVTAISRVLGGGRWCYGLLCVTTVWRTAVARVVCRELWCREMWWGEGICGERDG